MLISSLGQRWRHACLWGAMSLVLTACGGGGADPRKTEGEDPTRQPAGVVDPASAAYLVTESSPLGASGLNAHQLNLIDPVSGEVFKSISVGGQWASYELAGEFIAPGASGPPFAVGNATVLFFIRQYDNGDRQLFRMPLVGAQAGQETRVSNLVDACAIRETQPARLNDPVSWVRVSRAGPDHDCSSSADNHFALVRSDQGSGASDSPFEWPFGLEDALAWEYNAQGDMAWLYGYNTRLGLAAVRFTNGETLALTPGPTGQVVRAFSPYMGDGDKMLVLAGQDLRTFSWSNGTAVLGPAVMTLSSPSSRFQWVGTDERGMYVLEGLNLHRIDPQGVVSLMTTLPAGGVRETVQTPSALIILQSTYEPPPVGVPGEDMPIAYPTLWVVAKTGHAGPVTIETPRSENLFLAGVSGEAVIYGTRTPSGYVTLKRFMANHASQAPSTVATDVRYFYGVNEREASPYADRNTSHLLWCEVNGLPNNCRADQLRSYRLSTDTVLNLGPSSSSSSPPQNATWEIETGDIDYIDLSYRGILEGWQGGKRVSWLMKLDQAQSFKDIALP